MASSLRNSGNARRRKSDKEVEHIIPIEIENQISSSNDKLSNNTSIVSCTDHNSEEDDNSMELNGEETKEVSDLTHVMKYIPEKIIIVLDCAQDEDSTYFQLASGKKYTPLSMLKFAIQMFLHNKHFIDDRHKFALVLLNENSAQWIHDFTVEPQDIIESMNSVTPCEPEDVFSLNSMFDVITQNISLDLTEYEWNVPPADVFRVVLFYGRSYSVPELILTTELQNLLNMTYFTLDVIMTHEPPSSINHCQKIFETLQSLDKKELAYSFPVSRNTVDLHTATATILKHSLQRPRQFESGVNTAND